MPKTTKQTEEKVVKKVTKKTTDSSLEKSTTTKPKKAPVKSVEKTEKETKTPKTNEIKASTTKTSTAKTSEPKATSKVKTKGESTPAVETTATSDASDATENTSGKIMFKDFGLKPELQKAIDSLGYDTPTQIQAEVWNAAQSGTNIVGQSQTGTGKTTAFLLPLLQSINNRDRFPQVLIVAPTRELVQQIREDIMKLTEFLPMRSLCLIGGRKLMYQKEDLKYGPQFLVATPGRLIEFIQKRLIDTSKITHFVLDEVDRMLDMGFIEDVDRIWDQLNNLKQTMTFSATINDEIKHVINKHCDDFIHIRVGEKITVDKIDHTYIDIAHEHKFKTLLHILSHHQNQKTIIFSQTKRNTEVLTKALKDAKHTCAYLNGDLDQRERNRALRAFKEGTCKILITTDVAARGLNMDNVELVINFDVPREPESYIHRIGRTGRAGAEGKALMFVDRDEQHLIMDIEKTQKIKLKKSADYTGVTDEKMDYIDVNLDRPLPPSEKKRRMVARSLARERGEFGHNSRGGFGGGRSSQSRGRSGGNYGRSSFGNGNSGNRENNRGNRDGGYGSSRNNNRDSEKRSSYGRSDFSRNDYNRGERSDSRRNDFDQPRRQESRFGSRDRDQSRGRSGGNSRSSGGFGQSSFGRGESSFGSRSSSSRGGSSRQAPRRTIGGYDPVEVIQTNINASRGPRPPKDFSFNQTANTRKPSDRKPSDRRSFDRKPADRRPADRRGR